MNEPDSRRKIRYITWQEVHEIIGSLANRLIRDYIPEIIIAIAKGGLIPARILSDILGVDEIGFIEVKFYKSIGVRSEKPFIKYISIPYLKDRNVLVVDDVVDSGRTIQLVVDSLAVHAPKQLRTFALYLKPWSTYIPDYYFGITDEWIVYPWETCEAKKEKVELNNQEFRELGMYCVS
ncbi:MAG: phosphoribosyltransferase family protein [Desulfurococcaceae archaeon]